MRARKEPDIELKNQAARGLLDLIHDNARALCWWVALIAAAFIGFWLSEGTNYHHIAVGCLMTATTLFILTALFEMFRQTISKLH